MKESIETIIIGAGQAGLSLSHYLNHAGREHVVLEKSAQVADAWRNRRWDSFTLVTPNWTFQLPGAPYDGNDPEGFISKSEIVERFEKFEQENQFPVRYSTRVTAVEPSEGQPGYDIVTVNNEFHAMNVVTANGMFQKAKIPAFASKIPSDTFQIPSDYYKNPQQLPSGAVLVVGSGQSGCQIAEELNAAGQTVYLATSSAGRVHRRYRGKDGVDWLNRIGFFDRTPEMLSSPPDRSNASPHATGKDGGHDINLHAFSRDGITLLGHIQGFADGKLNIALDLKENLAKSDAFAANLLHMIDEYIEKVGLDASVEEVTILTDGYDAPVLPVLDLAAHNIHTIIWACGYTMESLVKLPVMDSYGFPITNRGVTQFPGLFFLGMPWMNKFKSGLLMGISESAQYLAEVIDQKATRS